MDELEARQAESLELHEEAAQLAHEVIGLPVQQARARIAEDSRFSVRLAEPDGAVTLDFRSGRITLVVRDGTVGDTLIG